MAAIADRCAWIETAGSYRVFPRLTGVQKTDWLIIGGGLTGLGAAHRLARIRPQDRIVLIEAKRVAQGASGRNSGFVIGQGLPEALSYGISGSVGRSAADEKLDRAGGEGVKALIAEHRIACDYQEDGYYYAAHDARLFDHAERYAELIQQSGGSSRVLDKAALTTRYGTDFYAKGIWIGGKGSGFLHSAKFSKGLADALPANVEVYETTRAGRLSARRGGGVAVEIAGGSIEAQKVIVGLNAFLPRFGYKRDRIFPVALAASMTRPLTDREEAGIGRAEPWALLSPVKGGCTIRLTRDRRLLVRNVAEYRPEGFDGTRLAKHRETHKAGLAKRFPWLPADAIEFTWSGAICCSRNSAFVFEEMQPGVFAAACNNGNGVARATLLGRLIADHAVGDRNALVETALAMDKPTRIPPLPLFRPLATLQFMAVHRQAHSET